MKINIIGATGATGSELLTLALQDQAISEVHVFVRREIEITHPKLKVHIINFDATESWANLVSGDALFSCLGTTLRDAGGKDAQWKVDYEYQLAFAMAAKQNGIDNYLLISSAGASSSSKIFYARMKGELEDEVKALNFEKCTIFRPPLLLRPETERMGEKIASKVIHFLNKIGLLKSQQPMPVDLLAKAMLKAHKHLSTGFNSYEQSEIRELAN